MTYSGHFDNNVTKLDSRYAEIEKRKRKKNDKGQRQVTLESSYPMSGRSHVRELLPKLGYRPYWTLSGYQQPG